MKCLLVLFLLFFTALISAQPEFAVKGVIYDELTNQRLEGALIIENDNCIAISNKDGLFNFTHKAGTYKFLIRFIAYDEKIIETEIDNVSTLIIKLHPKPIELENVTINGEYFTIKPVINSYNILPASLANSPQMLEVDVLRAFQTLPGVTSSSDYSSQISVRGGSPDETMILLDGIPVYNPYHLLSLFGSVNSDILKNARLYLSNYPHNFGGALSAVLDMNTKNGNNERVKGSLSVGLVSLKAELNGPVGNGNFVAAFRRPYFDIITNMKKINFPYYFYDIFSKINYPIGNYDFFSLSFFHSKDIYRFDDNSDFFENKEDANWGNTIINLSNTHFFDSRNNVELKLFYSGSFVGADTKMTDDNNQFHKITIDSLYINNSISDFTGKLDFKFFLTGQELNFGFELKRLNYKYDWIIGKHDLKGLAIHPLANIFFDYADNPFYYNKKETYLNSYFTDKIILNKSGSVDASLRISYITGFKELMLLPAVSYKYKYSPDVQLHASYGKYYQSSYALKEEKTDAMLSPFTASFLAENASQISTSHHFSVGSIFTDLIFENVSLEFEAYYKLRKNILTSYETSNSTGEVKQENGFAAGFDVLLKKEDGFLSGWIGYSFLRSEKSNDYFNYFAPYDRTHNAKVNLNFNIYKSWQLNVFWTYSSGLPFTVTAGKFIAVSQEKNPYGYDSQGGFWILSARKNSARFSDNRRLDVGLTGTIMWGDFVLKPYFQIYNLLMSYNYAFNNPTEFNSYNNLSQKKGSFIFPAFGISVEF